MAHQFTSELHNFRTQFPFMEINIDHPNMAQLNHQLSEIGQSILENHQNPTSSSSLHNTSFMVPVNVVSGDNFFTHQEENPEFSMSLVESGNFHHQPNNNNHDSNFFFSNNNISISHQPVVDELFGGNYNKRKAVDISESSSLNSSPQVSATDELKMKTTNSRKGKKVKISEVEEKPQEVVHVRARRGQATDSHSLAERVRRGKINERLKCLQDIVPGCYKSMGMAVMLDEIINYVQSLQNQVEFLSMKLTAASTFYDFNSEADDIETMQRAKAQEGKEFERITREGYGEVPINCFHSPSTWTL